MLKTLAAYTKDKLTQRNIEVQPGVGVTETTGTQLVITNGQVIDTRTIISNIGYLPERVFICNDAFNTGVRVKFSWA